MYILHAKYGKPVKSLLLVFRRRISVDLQKLGTVMLLIMLGVPKSLSHSRILMFLSTVITKTHRNDTFLRIQIFA